MPRKDLQSVWSLLADILREVTPIVRWSIVAGLAAGLAGCVYLTVQVPGSDLRLVLGRALWPLAGGLVLAGGFLGLVLGIVLQVAVEAVRGPRPPDRRGRGGRRR
jgi:hypothetical protein